ncbi:MAG TPA: hypothetical protein VIK71_03620 [Flavobacteriales bacterium]
MRYLLIISLISGLLLIHAGATLQHLLGETTSISVVMGAEEEEETHGTGKISKGDIPTHIIMAFNVIDSKSLLEVYDSSAICRYESNRIELPPEL